FAPMPSVVAEGRRVIANVERTGSLFVTKTVYVFALALAVGVVGVAFPFLPRHLTLAGSLTIGIPGFFLALEPNTTRSRPGFLSRILRFAIPAGPIAAAATLTAYALARQLPAPPGPTGAFPEACSTAWIRPLRLAHPVDRVVGVPWSNSLRRAFVLGAKLAWAFSSSPSSSSRPGGQGSQACGYHG